MMPDTIDQTGFKSLLMKRLEHPDLYEGRPLVIWNSDLGDGIQQRILKQAVEDYNKGCEVKRCWKIDLDGGIVLLSGISMIVYESTPIEFGRPENYPDAEQYIFKPDFDEWAEWLAAQHRDAVPLIDFIIDFISDGGDEFVRKYRWDNRLDIILNGKFTGCEYPGDWHDVVDNLCIEFVNGNYDSVTDLHENVVRQCFSSSNISDDIVEDFITAIRIRKFKAYIESGSFRDVIYSRINDYEKWRRAMLRDFNDLPIYHKGRNGIMVDLRLDGYRNYEYSNHAPCVYFRVGENDSDFLPMIIADTPYVPYPFEQTISDEELCWVRSWVKANKETLLRYANEEFGYHTFMSLIAKNKIPI